MSRTIAILLALVLTAGPALAAKKQMTCKNARRSYLVTFDDANNTFRLGTAGSETFYQVEGVEDDEQGPVVRGKTIKGGPDFVAYLGESKRIEFIDGGQVMQTDPCE